MQIPPTCAGSGPLIQQEQADGGRISLGSAALISREAKRGGHFSKGKFDKLLLWHREIRGFFSVAAAVVGMGRGGGSWLIVTAMTTDV